MQIQPTTVPASLREAIGQEASFELLTMFHEARAAWRDDVLTLATERVRLGAAVTLGCVAPKTVKFKSPVTVGGITFFTRLTAKGRICGALPNFIVITNPGQIPSNSFNCTERCPTSQ